MSVINQQVYAAPGVLYPGIGGGGGGSNAPVQSFSTINMNPSIGSLNWPVGSSSFQMVYDNIQDNNNSTINTLSFELSTTAVSLGLDVAVGALLVQGDGGSSGSAPSAKLNVTSGNMFVNAPTTGNIYILSPTSISSLTVSSINGAAPGGGGAYDPNPAYSTVTASTIGAPGKNALQVVSPVIVQGNLEATGSVTADAGVSIAAGQQLTFVGGTGNVSGLSSFNGAIPFSNLVYPIPSAAGVSTLTAGLTYIPAGNVAWPLSGDIPVTSGHTYRISGNLAMSNGGSGHTSLLISGGGVGFPVGFASYPNTELTPTLNGAAGGIQTVFVPLNPAVQVIAYNTDASVSTAAEFYNVKWLVEDLGANIL